MCKSDPRRIKLVSVSDVNQSRNSVSPVMASGDPEPLGNNLQLPE